MTSGCPIEPSPSVSLPTLEAPPQARPPGASGSTGHPRGGQTTTGGSPRKEAIRNGRLEVIGYRETTGSLEILWDAHGRQLGVFELATKITRDRRGKVVGLYVNQLLQLL